MLTYSTRMRVKPRLRDSHDLGGLTLTYYDIYTLTIWHLTIHLGTHLLSLGAKKTFKCVIPCPKTWNTIFRILTRPIPNAWPQIFNVSHASDTSRKELFNATLWISLRSSLREVAERSGIHLLSRWCKVIGFKNATDSAGLSVYPHSSSVYRTQLTSIRTSRDSDR